MEDWTLHISTRTLAKGIDYFEAGCVQGLVRRSDGWHATVSGYEDYSVFVPTSLDPYHASCTCPHYADGNICKHIAATIMAVEQRVNDDEDARADGAGERIEDLVKRADLAELRAFVVEYAYNDEAFERELRATFGVADAKQAKRELQKVTTSLMHSYERGGFIDWRGALDFEHAYTNAVESIMRPFYTAQDVDALIDLAIVRLVQLQRICIDDSDGFFTDALGDVFEHMDKAYTLGNVAQRERLLDVLGSFVKKNPGKDRGDVYWFEREVVEEFLVDRYARDAAFAPRMIELVDERLSELPSDLGEVRGHYDYERTKWMGVRLKAMAALGETPDALRSCAEEHALLETADTVRLLAEEYEAAGMSKKAVDLLRDHLDAREPHHVTYTAAKPPRIVDCLVSVAKSACTPDEQVALYTMLLYREPGRATATGDQIGWYDEMHRLVGEAGWANVRAKLLDEVPYQTGNTLLAHERSYEELYERIMAHGGADLSRFESVLAEEHPEPYIEHYISSALSSMSRASDRRAYKEIARDLAHAAGLPGGEGPAWHAVASLRAKYPRRPALHDELRKAGFPD